MPSHPLLYIAGPCVLEDEEIALSIGRRLLEITEPFGVRFVFKASYDKANRTSVEAYRGPGLTRGLEILRTVKQELGVPVLSDIHDVTQVGPAAEVLDYLQIPAFLCRQTDLLVEAGRSGKIVNIKKGQFVAPEDLRFAIGKVESTGNHNIVLTERGTFFGYHNLVVDFRSFDILRDLGYPVVFDATHSVQRPSAGGTSGGNREYVMPLARAAAAYGIDGLFTEVYPDPALAKCDGPNSLPLDDVPTLLRQVTGIRSVLAEG
ncbi:MAG: 3-deoxy-8-phosphooctulonate synthase [Candidatus Hydrogenedens sp.]|nr:3-deoxy-8-phosphooctulonate synthase [Candidatus Hydrogenedens sp.]